MTRIVSEENIKNFIVGMLGPFMHKAKAESIANAVFDALFSMTLSSAELGRAVATQRSGIVPKHGSKQVDRLLGNDKFLLDELFAGWIPWLVAAKKHLTVTLDWTCFDADNQSTLVVNLITKPGRATPLAWMSVERSTLKGRRNEYEYELLSTVKRHVPEGVRLTVLADRGFGDVKLYEFIKRIHWDYVIRFRGNIYVESKDGRRRKVQAWLADCGYVRQLKEARVTSARYQVASAVITQKKGMETPWFLGTSLSRPKTTVMKLCGRRFTCEEKCRDTKDIRFGMGFSTTRVSTVSRRDRFLAIGAIATAILTLLGWIGEKAGFDALIRANTEQSRTHSLPRQGREYLRLNIDFVVAHLVKELRTLIRAQRYAADAVGIL